MSAPKTEEALMTAYVAGDGHAFEKLFAMLAPRIHAFFVRSFADRSLADDLLQVTFLKVHRARADYRPDLPLRPWLYAIAARVRLDELRRKYRLPETADEDQLDAAMEASAQSAAEERAASQDSGVVEAVRGALSRLPESQRLVVQLHRYEGLTFPEIARSLGTTEGAIKLRAFRAYERLRKELRGLVAQEDAPSVRENA